MQTNDYYLLPLCLKLVEKFNGDPKFRTFRSHLIIIRQVLMNKLADTS